MVKKFLADLFGNKPKEDYILVWQVNDKKTSHWFKDIKSAANCITKYGSECNVYFGCGTAPKKYPSYFRCKADEIAGIPGVWLDVDYSHPCHKKTGLPKTPEIALKIIKAFPLAPTLIVNSGHGFHAWWLFDQFKEITTSIIRAEVSDLLPKFAHYMLDYARVCGCENGVDPAHDLARVLRPPETINFKDGYADPTSVFEDNGPRHSYDDFHAALTRFIGYLGDDATPYKRGAKTVTIASIVEGQYTIDPNAEPPKEKFEALCAFEPRFAASWEASRSDFKDKSPSSYDMSLATMAANAEWEPQEIIDLIMAFRRKHGFDIKRQLKEDYFTKFTLPKAYETSQKNQAYDELDKISLSIQQLSKEVKVDPSPENVVALSNEYAKAREKVSLLIGVNIKRIIQYQADPPEYKMETDQSCIHVGAVQNLIEQKYFRRKLADATKVYLSQQKPDKWEKIAFSLLQAAETVLTSDDTTSRGQIRAWITSYLSNTDPLYCAQDAAAMCRPFYEGHRLYFFGPELRRHISIHLRDVVSAKTFGIMLRDYGYQSEVKMFKSGNRWISRSVWYIDIDRDKVAESFVNKELLNNANRLSFEEQEGKDKGSDVDDF